MGLKFFLFSVVTSSYLSCMYADAPLSSSDRKKLNQIGVENVSVGINLPIEQLKSHARFIKISHKKFPHLKAGFLNALPGLHTEMSYQLDAVHK